MLYHRSKNGEVNTCSEHNKIVKILFYLCLELLHIWDRENNILLAYWHEGSTGTIYEVETKIFVYQ